MFEILNSYPCLPSSQQDSCFTLGRLVSIPSLCCGQTLESKTILFQSWNRKNTWCLLCVRKAVGGHTAGNWRTPGLGPSWPTPDPGPCGCIQFPFWPSSDPTCYNSMSQGHQLSSVCKPRQGHPVVLGHQFFHKVTRPIEAYLSSQKDPLVGSCIISKTKFKTCDLKAIPYSKIHDSNQGNTAGDKGSRYAIAAANEDKIQLSRGRWETAAQWLDQTPIEAVVESLSCHSLSSSFKLIGMNFLWPGSKRT